MDGEELQRQHRVWLRLIPKSERFTAYLLAKTVKAKLETEKRNGSGSLCLWNLTTIVLHKTSSTHRGARPLDLTAGSRRGGPSGCGRGRVLAGVSLRAGPAPGPAGLRAPASWRSERVSFRPTGSPATGCAPRTVSPAVPFPGAGGAAGGSLPPGRRLRGAPPAAAVRARAAPAPPPAGIRARAGWAPRRRAGHPSAGRWGLAAPGTRPRAPAPGPSLRGALLAAAGPPGRGTRVCGTMLWKHCQQRKSCVFLTPTWQVNCPLAPGEQCGHRAADARMQDRHPPPG
nr:translation initiation factor IF-2 [Manis javanica]